MPALVGVAVGLLSSGVVTGGLIYAGVGLTSTLFWTITMAVTGLVSDIVNRAIMGGANVGDLGTTINMGRDSAAPREYVYGRARVGGTMTYIETTGSDNNYGWFVNTIVDREIESFEAFYIADDLVTVSAGAVTTSPYNGFANVWTKLGEDSQTVETNLDAASGTWTSDHRLRGCAYVVWRLLFDNDVFPSGLPNLSVTVKGLKVYDPRLDSTVSGGSGSHRDDDPTTWEWSENPVLCLLDYLRDDYMGPGFPMAAFDTANIIAAANICDEQVTLKSGGTENRYAVNGVLNSDLEYKDVIEFFSDAMGGTVTAPGGILRMYPGQYDTVNTDTLGEDDIIEVVSWRPAPSRRELVNEVRGLFIDPNAGYQPTEYPARTDATAVTEDGGDVLPLTLDFPFEQSQARAQRIAQLTLNSARQRGSGSIRCNLSALAVQVWDLQKFTLSDENWTDKVLRITGWSLDPDSATVILDVKEDASSVYSWTAASDEQDYTSGTAPNINPFGTSVATPFGVVTIPYVITTTNGATSPGVNVQWAAPNEWVAETQVEVKDSTSGDVIATQVVPKGTTEVLLPAPAGGYDVELKNIDWIGRQSALGTDTVTVTDSTVSDTIVDQGDLAIIDQVDTAEIVDYAAAIHHYDSFTTNQTLSKTNGLDQEITALDTTVTTSTDSAAEVIVSVTLQGYSYVSTDTQFKMNMWIEVDGVQEGDTVEGFHGKGQHDVKNDPTPAYFNSSASFNFASPGGSTQIQVFVELLANDGDGNFNFQASDSVTVLGGQMSITEGKR
jgi:hypothetical protein